MIKEKTSFENISSVLVFHNYVVNEIQFTSNPSYEEQSVEIDLKVKKTVEQELTDEGKLINLVTLDILLFENMIENNYPFSMTINITGIFEINKEHPDYSTLSEEDKRNVSEVNSVAILFPYIRALITTYTANSNVSPLILPPFNINKLIEAQAE